MAWAIECNCYGVNDDGNNGDDNDNDDDGDNGDDDIPEER